MALSFFKSGDRKNFIFNLKLLEEMGKLPKKLTRIN